MMLSCIKLTHFKCFEQLDLPCKRLNLLCGLNGMGKSSIFQVMLILRQSFESGELPKGRLLLGGDRADLGTGSDVLFEDADRDVLGFALRCDEAPDQWELNFGYSRTADQLTVLQDRTHTQDALVPENWQAMPPFGGNLVYVSAERVGPRKTYPYSEINARQANFGSDSEYAWSYLSQHKDDVLPEDDPRGLSTVSRRVLSVVDQWLQEVSPGAHVQLDTVAPADAIIPSFSFDRHGDVESRQHRATNVGFGLSYALPVILAFLSPPGTLCLVENPEAHLHPRGQTKLAELAVRAAKAGVQVFVETHSDHFMDGIRIAVRDGLINPEDTAFHYFDRDGNKSIVTSPAIDLDGRLSTWPVGFFDQHDENLVRLLAPRS